MSICVGCDLGGTKVILQAMRGQDTLALDYFQSRDYAGFEQVLRAFIDAHQLKVDALCVGVAGPVQHGQAQVTNLPWRLNAADLAAEFGIAKVELLNDFQVIGFALDALPNNELVCLQAATADPQGVRALIGAGTGLGHAILTRHGGQEQVLPSEAGHINFAPLNPQQDQLNLFMRQRYPQVSYERLVSGSGLEHIYWFLSGGEGDSPPLNAASVSQAALDNDALGYAAMQLFLSIYGAAAGNFALACLPLGGLYIAGGIAAKIQALMAGPAFLDAFHNKSKMADLMRRFPIYLITNQQVGLLGAVRRAGLL